jgi:hypothetical protein
VLHSFWNCSAPVVRVDNQRRTVETLCQPHLLMHTSTYFEACFQFVFSKSSVLINLFLSAAIQHLCTSMSAPR